MTSNYSESNWILINNEDWLNYREGGLFGPVGNTSITSLQHKRYNIIA